MIRLAIVCPCFNEEAVLSQSVKLLSGILAGLVYNGKVSADSFLMLVDDGSSDGTWKIIEDLHDGDKAGIKAISFSRNYGHQNAIFAGMMQCRGICDGVITMDVDLQDDPACIEQMVDAFSKGYDVVYGVRSARKADTFFKRFTAEAFYRLSQKLGNETVYNHADYRFLSARVLDVLASYEERGLYLRGLIPQIGFSSTTVSYERLARKEGETKFTFPKMLSLAVNGLTLSTHKPSLLIVGTGLLLIATSILMAVIFLLLGHAEDAWMWILSSLWFLSGVLLTAIGIMAVYVCKVLDETRHRPRFNIKEVLD